MERGEIRVLVVDDDPGVRRALLARLSNAGFRADAVAGGREALLACQSDPPQVVLLDVSMPEMDGYQVCERIRESIQDPVTVVFLTGATHGGTTSCSERVISQSGGDYFLSKPYDPELVVSLIDDIAGRGAPTAQAAHLGG